MQRAKRTGMHGTEKRREYGFGPSNPNTLFDGVVPVIFEQHGCPGPCAITFLHHILRGRVPKLEQGSHLTHGVAWMIASRELLAPISCILLVTRYQTFHKILSHCANSRQPQGAGSHGSPLNLSFETMGSRDSDSLIVSVCVCVCVCARACVRGYVCVVFQVYFCKWTFSSRTKRGIHKRGIHEKVKFLNFKAFYTVVSKRDFQKSP